MKAIQASASMPVFSRAVEIDGVPYLDGGCADKIAFQWALDQGFKKIIVVKTQPEEFRKEPMSEKEKRHSMRYSAIIRNSAKCSAAQMNSITSSATRSQDSTGAETCLRLRQVNISRYRVWKRIWKSWAVCII